MDQPLEDPVEQRSELAKVAIQDLTRSLTDMARDLDAACDGRASLDEVCARARTVIFGCRWAGINEARRDQRGNTLGTSDDTARDLHERQYDLDDGPWSRDHLKGAHRLV